MFRKIIRLLILKLFPRGRRGYYRTHWKVECTWGESADVSIMFDNSVHLTFGLTKEEAARLGNSLLKSAEQANQLELGLINYLNK